MLIAERLSPNAALPWCDPIVAGRGTSGTRKIGGTVRVADDRVAHLCNGPCLAGVCVLQSRLVRNARGTVSDAFL